MMKYRFEFPYHYGSYATYLVEDMGDQFEPGFHTTMVLTQRTGDSTDIVIIN